MVLQIPSQAWAAVMSRQNLGTAFQQGAAMGSTFTNPIERALARKETRSLATAREEAITAREAARNEAMKEVAGIHAGARRDVAASNEGIAARHDTTLKRIEANRSVSAEEIARMRAEARKAVEGANSEAGLITAMASMIRALKTRPGSATDKKLRDYGATASGLGALMTEEEKFGDVEEGEEPSPVIEAKNRLIQGIRDALDEGDEAGDIDEDDETAELIEAYGRKAAELAGIKKARSLGGEIRRFLRGLGGGERPPDEVTPPDQPARSGSGIPLRVPKGGDVDVFTRKKATTKGESVESRPSRGMTKTLEGPRRTPLPR